MSEFYPLNWFERKELREHGNDLTIYVVAISM
jgi:hypothetical protein